MSLFFSLWIKLFFVLTPFFGLTMFLSMTEDYQPARRRNLALSVAVAVAISSLILFFIGQQIFSVFGITVDAFRIGAGVLLMLSGISLVNGKAAQQTLSSDDVAVVPLAIPIFVGPATVGTLLVLGAELKTFSAKMTGSLALLFAVVCVAIILLASSFIKNCLGSRGIVILSKLTGLILAALSAQMIMTGIQRFLNLG